MTYNPDVRHRRSIRLKGYDYSKEGLYFVTICVQNRECLFGEIKNGAMSLNDAGEIARHELIDTPKHRKNVILHEHIIMPNHVHIIIEIAACRGVACYAQSLDIDTNTKYANGTNLGVARYAPTISTKPGTLSAIVRAYKSAVSKQLGFSYWQRNYYEHIIRNERSYQKISEYIQNNPQNWRNDKFYMEG